VAAGRPFGPARCLRQASPSLVTSDTRQYSTLVAICCLLWVWRLAGFGGGSPRTPPLPAQQQFFAALKMLSISLAAGSKDGRQGSPLQRQMDNGKEARKIIIALFADISRRFRRRFPPLENPLFLGTSE